MACGRCICLHPLAVQSALGNVSESLATNCTAEPCSRIGRAAALDNGIARLNPVSHKSLILSTRWGQVHQQRHVQNNRVPFELTRLLKEFHVVYGFKKLLKIQKGVDKKIFRSRKPPQTQNLLLMSSRKQEFPATAEPTKSHVHGQIQRWLVF